MEASRPHGSVAMSKKKKTSSLKRPMPRSLSVRCDTCGMPVGQRCLSDDGRMHSDRTRKACILARDEFAAQLELFKRHK